MYSLRVATSAEPPGRGPRGVLREAKRGGTRSRRRNLRQTARFWRLRDGIPPRAPPSASTSEIPLIASSTLASSETTAGSTSKEERSRLCMAPAARPLSSLSGAERAVASSPVIVDSPMVLASAMPPVSCESICRVTTVRKKVANRVVWESCDLSPPLNSGDSESGGILFPTEESRWDRASSVSSRRHWRWRCAECVVSRARRQTLESGPAFGRPRRFVAPAPRCDSGTDCCIVKMMI